MKRNKFGIVILLKIVLCITFLSCKNNKQEPPLGIISKNYFLDTFSLLNLKGFGIGNEPIKLNDNIYYEFNQTKNSFPIKGFIRKDKGTVFFRDLLKKNSEYIFYSSEFKAKYQQESIIKRASDSSPMEIKFVNNIFNNQLNDTLTLISYTYRSSYNSIQPDEIIIFYTKSGKVLKFDFVNCRNDTLEMNFVNRNVFYKNRNADLQCL
ncbi:hypothetical protein BH11BAC3_BH11BAC3_07790 [soil metagenome]